VEGGWRKGGARVKGGWREGGGRVERVERNKNMRLKYLINF
jgi:hypothetical protein